MTCKPAVLLAVVACVFGPFAQAAAAAQSVRHRGAPRHAPHAPAAQLQSQIACTVLGCMPIPAACTPVAGRTPGGRPTGYDIIVCPPGTWPLK